jgi:hypothetical protein
MSRGLGSLQRRIVSEMNVAINRGAVSVRLRDLYARWPAQNRRSLERALKTLVDRGESFDRFGHGSAGQCVLLCAGRFT